MTYRKYISILATVACLFALLLTGCAKDELIPPAGEGTLLKSSESIDKNNSVFSVDTNKNSDSEDSDGITDDEDDEDDHDRSVNH